MSLPCCIAVVLLVLHAGAGARDAQGVSATEQPARRLPPTRTVCIDRVAARCWTEPGESRCVTPAPRTDTVFRVVIEGGDGRDVERALADCATALRDAGD